MEYFKFLAHQCGVKDDARRRKWLQGGILVLSSHSHICTSFYLQLEPKYKKTSQIKKENSWKNKCRLCIGILGLNKRELRKDIIRC